MGRLTELHHTLIRAYDQEGLQVLCADLDVAYEHLEGEALPARALSLIKYLDKRDRLPDLIAQASKDFPNLKWTLPPPRKPDEPDADDDRDDGNDGSGVSMKIGDVSGSVNIDGIANVKNNTGNIAVGSRNVIQIGTLNIPRRLAATLLAFIGAIGAIVIVLLGLNSARLFSITEPESTPVIGPTRMSGQFNIIVAQAAESDPTGVQISTPNGLRVSEWISNSLGQELKDFPNAQIWHDKLSLAEKGRYIGIITGTTAERRWQTAQELAQDTGAHLVIYGNLTPSGEFAPEVYIDVATNKLAGEADEIIGGHQMGTPMSVDASGADAGLAGAAEFQARAVFVRGLVYDLVGLHDKALEDFQRIKPRWDASVGKGKETLDYFLGREVNFMIDDESAVKRLFGTREAALKAAADHFSAALSINPNYGLAHIGLGNMLLKSGEPVIVDEASEPASAQFRSAMESVKQAIAQYDLALKAARESPERHPLLETKARISLANAHRLDGLAQFYMQKVDAAQNAFDLALRQLELSANGQGMDKSRIATIHDWVRGATLFNAGILKYALGEDAASLDLFRKSRDAFAACGEHYDDPENKRDTDRTLKDYKARCADQQQQVQKVIDNGGQP